MQSILKYLARTSRAKKIGASLMVFIILLVLSLASEKSTFKENEDIQTIDQLITTQTQTATSSAEVLFASPNIVGMNETRNITLQADGTAEKFRFYIHDSNTLNSTDPVVQSYNRTLQPGTFHYLGEASASNKYTLQIQYPTTPGMYKIVTNAVNGEYTCSWDKKLMKGTPGSTYTDTGQTCDNVGSANLRVESTLAGPSVNLNDPIPNKILGGTTQPILKILGNGGGSNKFPIYIHGTATPRDGTNTNPDIPKPLGSYEPNNVNPQDFYYLGDSYVKIAPPSEKGTYYVAVNSSEGNSICSWDKRMYTRNSDGSVTANGTCNNTGLKTLEVVYPSVPSGAKPADTELNPGDTVSFTIPETTSRRYWLYIHGSSEPKSNDPVVQNYNPNSVDSSTFYKIGAFAPNEQISFQTPSSPGDYYLVIDGHSDIDPNNWTENDRVCSWEQKVLKQSPTGTQILDDCINPGPIKLTAVDSNPQSTTTPTINPDPTSNPDPTGTTPTATTTVSQPPPGSTTLTPTHQLNNSPTPTTTQNAEVSIIKFNVQTKFPGIGNSPGDNINPLEKFVDAGIILIDRTRDAIAGGAMGYLSFESNSGTYNGTIEMEIYKDPSETTNETYDLAFFTDTTAIPILLPVSYTYQGNQVITLPLITQITGDINGDFVIDMRDYSLLISCYGFKQKSQSCKNQTISDLNYDGVVNGVDYNILLRHFNQLFSLQSEQPDLDKFKDHFIKYLESAK